MNDEIRECTSDSITTAKFSVGNEFKKVNKHVLDVKDKVDGEKSKRLPRIFSHSVFRRRKSSQENSDLKSIQLNTEAQSKNDLKSKEQVHLNAKINKHASDSFLLKNDSLAKEPETVNKKYKEDGGKTETWSQRFSRVFFRKKKK